MQRFADCVIEGEDGTRIVREREREREKERRRNADFGNLYSRAGFTVSLGKRELGALD